MQVLPIIRLVFPIFSCNGLKSLQKYLNTSIPHITDVRYKTESQQLVGPLLLDATTGGTMQRRFSINYSNRRYCQLEKRQ